MRSVIDYLRVFLAISFRLSFILNSTISISQKTLAKIAPKIISRIPAIK